MKHLLTLLIPLFLFTPAFAQSPGIICVTVRGERDIANMTVPIPFYNTKLKVVELIRFSTEGRLRESIEYQVQMPGPLDNSIELVWLRPFQEVYTLVQWGIQHGTCKKKGAQSCSTKW